MQMKRSPSSHIVRPVSLHSTLEAHMMPDSLHRLERAMGAMVQHSVVAFFGVTNRGSNSLLREEARVAAAHQYVEGVFLSLLQRSPGPDRRHRQHCRSSGNTNPKAVVDQFPEIPHKLT